MAIWVKICGVTRVEDAHAAFECGADAIGINFWPRSKRYCEPARAREIVRALPAEALVFGVFCDASRDDMAALASEVGLGGIQLHGSEPEAACEGWPLPVIRAVAAKSREAVLGALAFRRPGVRLLVDNAAGGGSGRLIDTQMLNSVDLGDAILAGGLTPQNVADTVARFGPYGVDTAGGVETVPGVKDAKKIADFIAAARGARRSD